MDQNHNISQQTRVQSRLMFQAFTESPVRIEPAKRLPANTSNAIVIIIVFLVCFNFFFIWAFAQNMFQNFLSGILIFKVVNTFNTLFLLFS